MLGFYVPPVGRAPEPEFRLAQIMECQCPHTIIVNSRGERFSDESYFQDTVEAIRRYDIWSRTYINSPSYLIFDSQYVKGFSFAGGAPGTDPPQWVSRGDTLHQLAAKLDVSSEGLARTVARFNGFAHEGVDHDFHRGEKKWSLASREAIKGGNPLNRRLGTVEELPVLRRSSLCSGSSYRAEACEPTDMGRLSMLMVAEFENCTPLGTRRRTSSTGSDTKPAIRSPPE